MAAKAAEVDLTLPQNSFELKWVTMGLFLFSDVLL